MERRPRRARRIAAAVFVAGMLASVLLGMRTYQSYLLMRSAQAAGAPATSSIRPWMTLDYISTNFQVPDSVLLNGLALPPATDMHTSLKNLAEREGEAPLDYVRRVQKAIAQVEPRLSSGEEANGSAGLSTLGDESLSAVLTYGYSALGLTVLLGSIGVPVPDGLATAVAGSLAAHQQMEWAAAALVVLSASVLGDAIAYLLGRLLGRGVLERHGQWFGYTPERATRVRRLFERWGGWAVLITRTFASYLSSVASVLAGASRYALAPYFAFTVVGRVTWTTAYLGLGYAVGADLQAATNFLANLSGLLIALAVLAASGWVAFGPAPALTGSTP